MFKSLSTTAALVSAIAASSLMAASHPAQAESTIARVEALAAEQCGREASKSPHLRLQRRSCIEDTVAFAIAQIAQGKAQASAESEQATGNDLEKLAGDHCRRHASKSPRLRLDQAACTETAVAYAKQQLGATRVASKN